MVDHLSFQSYLRALPDILDKVFKDGSTWALTKAVYERVFKYCLAI